MAMTQKGAIISTLLLLARGQAPPCPDKLHGVFADMHDGDKKEISLSANSLTIKPSGNSQQWIVKTAFDSKSCSANVDFNVPGKPSPPPVNLTATLWSVLSSNGEKTEFEFTDPSGTLAAKNFPLNRWVELIKASKQTHVPCQKRLQAVYADMHDGDKKLVILGGEGGSDMIIKPYGNNQTWIVKTKVDPKTCSAVIDFNVPGKPGPPPVNLTATFLYNERQEGKDRKTEYEFSDPSGTLAAAGFPLNHWVEISRDPLTLDNNACASVTRDACNIKSSQGYCCWCVSDQAAHPEGCYETSEQPAWCDLSKGGSGCGAPPFSALV